MVQAQAIKTSQTIKTLATSQTVTVDFVRTKKKRKNKKQTN